MIAHFNLTSGASGDKMVACMLDICEQAGWLTIEELESQLAGICPELEVRREVVCRQGLVAPKVTMIDARTGLAADADAGDHSHNGEGLGGSQRHAHNHEHPQDGDHPHGHDHSHAHAHWADIKRLLEESSLPQDAKQLAIAIFERVAAAEALVHGKDPSEVAFHEIGALDSIGDIVGASILATTLMRNGVERFAATPITLGFGTIDCAHGTLPVPAPATALIAKGLPTCPGKVRAEITTPTGAAIIAQLASDYCPAPAMRSRYIGAGAGKKDFDGLPNILRLTVGDVIDDAALLTSCAAANHKPPESRLQGIETYAQDVVALTCDIDHLSGEATAIACERILAAGALDVWQAPIVMKKGRIGIHVEVLAAKGDADDIARTAMRLLGTLGMRRAEMSRHVAHRALDVVGSPWGDLRVKSMLTRDPSSQGGEPPERIWVRVEADDVAQVVASTGECPAQVAGSLSASAAQALGGDTGSALER